MFIKKIILLIALVGCLICSVEASNVEKNAIIIVLEGTSRSTLYPLIERGKLTHISSIIKRGNFRNLDIKGINSTYEETYLSILTGYEQDELEITSKNYYADISFFEQVKQYSPSINTVVLFTPPDDPNSEPVVMNLMTSLVDKNATFSSIKARTSYQIGLDTSAVISDITSPFVIFINYTNIDRVGRRYREGGELYSQAILNCNRSIGLILNALEENNTLENTDILITTTYGMKEKTKYASEFSWVISSKKTQRKGVIQDIVPSLYDLLDIRPINNEYFGKSIFKFSEKKTL